MINIFRQIASILQEESNPQPPPSDLPITNGLQVYFNPSDGNYTSETSSRGERMVNAVNTGASSDFINTDSQNRKPVIIHGLLDNITGVRVGDGGSGTNPELKLQQYVDFGETYASDFTLCLVIKRESEYQQFDAVMSGNPISATPDHLVYYQGSGFDKVGISSDINTDIKRRTSNFESNDLECIIITNNQIFLNGVEQTYVDSDVLTNLVLSRLGARTGTNLLNSYNGYIFEVAFYNIIHSYSDITSIWNYFDNKYKITPPSVDITNLNKHIDYISGDDWFGYSSDSIEFSQDSGQTWVSRLWTDSNDIDFSYIFDDGKVLIAVQDKIYQWVDKTQDPVEITVKRVDGSNYIPHTPVNPNLRGGYFHNIRWISKMYPNNVERPVWGNYCNVFFGACPANFYDAVVNGNNIEVRVIYEFGQNGIHRDDGSSGGGNAGTLLGDSSNPNITRHTHDIIYHEPTDTFYACTGDHGTTDVNPFGDECHLLRGNLNSSNNTWSWNIVHTSAANGIFKTSTLEIKGDYMYWGSDSTSETAYYGLYFVKLSDFDDEDKIFRMHKEEVIVADLKFSGDKCLMRRALTDTMYVSSNRMLSREIITGTPEGGRFLSDDLGGGKFLIQTGFPRKGTDDSLFIQIN